MPERLTRHEFADRASAAHYVAALAADLAQIAQAHQFETLTYLLDMARMEAETIVRDERP